MGRRFDGVRVHNGAPAARLAQDLDAEAFTIGNHVVFGDGRYSPGTPKGDRLLAHELTHVVQQRSTLDGERIQRTPTTTVVDVRPEPAGRTGEAYQTEPEPTEAAERRAETEDERYDFARLREEEPDVARAVYRLSTRAGHLLTNVDVSIRRAGVQATRQQAHALQRFVDYQTRIRNRHQLDASHLYVWALKLQYALYVLRPILDVLETQRGFGGAADAFESDRRSLLADVERFKETPFLIHGSEEVEREHVERSEAERRQAFIDRLRERARRNWSAIQARSSLFAPIFARMLMDEFGRDPERLREFFERLRSTNPRLLDVILLEGETVREIQGESDVGASLGRVLLHAVMGEFHEGQTDVQPGELDDLREFGATTRQGEANVEDITSITLDTAITLIPIVDQLGDLRDLSAHLVYLLNLDGEHENEYQDPWRWLGVVFTLIGFVPEVGSVIRGIGRFIIRAARGVGSVTARVVSTIAESIMGFLRRQSPRLADFVETLLSHVSGRWNRFTRTATETWDEAARRIDSLLEGASTFLERRVRRIRARWRLVRRAARRRIPESLRNARRYLIDVFGAVLGSLRRGGEAVAERVSGVGRRLAEPVAERLARVRDRVAAVAARVRERVLSMTATGRMRLLSESLDELDDVQARLVRAASEGNDRLVGELAEEAERIAARAERRLGGIEAPAAQPGRAGAGRSGTRAGAPRVEGRARPSGPAARRPHEPRASEPVPEAAPPPRPHVSGLPSAAEAASEARRAVDGIRPSAVEGYVVEIPLGDDRFWRRTAEGRWCRFASPGVCGDSELSEAVEEVVEEAPAARSLLDETLEEAPSGERASTGAAPSGRGPVSDDPVEADMARPHDAPPGSEAEPSVQQPIVERRRRPAWRDRPEPAPAPRTGAASAPSGGHGPAGPGPRPSEPDVDLTGLDPAGTRRTDILEEFAEVQERFGSSQHAIPGRPGHARSAVEGDLLEELDIPDAARARQTPGGAPVPEHFEVGNFSHRYAERLIPESELPRGLRAEFTIRFQHPDADRPITRRVDRIDLDRRIVYEIKPDTPGWRRRGEDQARFYAALMDEADGLPPGTWSYRVVTYDRDAVLALMRSLGWLE